MHICYHIRYTQRFTEQLTARMMYSCTFQAFLFIEIEEPPVCVTCNTTIIVKLTLIECADLVDVRKNYFEERLCIHYFEM